MSTPQYQWISKSGSNVDVDLLKELSKLKPLDEEDFHPLQKRDSQHLQQTQKVKTERNPIKGKLVRESPKFLDPLTALSEQDDLLETSRIKSKSDFDEIGDHFCDSTDSSNSDSSTQESSWRCLECDVTEECQNFGGKIEIPAAMQYLLPKVEDSENENNLASVSARLEWLESRGKGRNNISNNDTQSSNLLTASQFSNFVETTTNQLAKYWKDDQRVSVVKLVIQAAKMLAEPDPQILEFYPALFFALTDLITYFGQLVYDRLVSKCPGLKVNFTLTDVSDTARELCKNWLYKIASIRELVPRFYLETALLRCYRFSCNLEGFPALIERLVLMARGIGDPLVAAYARVYLTFVVQQALQASAPQLVRNVGRQNYEEFLSVFKFVGFNEIRYMGPIRLSDYLTMYSAAIRWFINVQTVGLQPEDHARDKILKRCFNEMDNLNHPGLLIRHLLESCPANLFAGDCTRLCQVVTSCDDSGYPAHILLRTFGRKLVETSNILSTKPKSVLLGILNQCWKVIMKMVDIDNYLSCAPVFVEFSTQHFGAKEIDVLLGDVLSHVANAREQPKMTSQQQQQQQKAPSDPLTESSKVALVTILRTSLGLNKSELVSKNNFRPSEMMSELTHLLPLVDSLDSKNRVGLARDILESLQQLGSKLGESESNPPDPESILYLAGILADSVNALTIQDETRQISQLICLALNELDFVDDYDRRLKFLTDCRAKFNRLEVVQIHLVYSVLNMAMEALKNVRQQNDTRRRPRIHGFLQACCAFAYITIPSVSNVCTKLRLYLLTSQVGYHSRCFGQAEDSIRTSVTLIQEVAENVQNFRTVGEKEQLHEIQTFIVNDFTANLLSYLLVVPDIPRSGKKIDEHLILTIVKGLINGVRVLAKDDQWGLSQVYLKCLQTLSTAAWSSYPYHIDGVDASDIILFESVRAKSGFVNQLNKLSTLLLDQLLHRLEYYRETGEHLKRNQLALNILEVLVKLCTLEDGKMTSLALKLWKICNETTPGITRIGSREKQAQKLLSHLKTLRQSGDQLGKLIERMEQDLKN